MHAALFADQRNVMFKDSQAGLLPPKRWNKFSSLSLTAVGQFMVENGSTGDLLAQAS